MGRKSCPILVSIHESIIPLNNSLPEEFGYYWVTSKEIHERLIHAGVDRSLKLTQVQNALKNYNPAQTKLKVHEYSGANYFRPTKVHLTDTTTVPSDQRFKGKATGPNNRINYNPPRDYFKNNGNGYFTTINENLLKLEEKEGREAEKKRSEFIYFTIQYWLLLSRFIVLLY